MDATTHDHVDAVPEARAVPLPAVPPAIRFDLSAADKAFLADTLRAGLKLQDTVCRKWTHAASATLLQHMTAMIEGGQWPSHTADPAALEALLGTSASILASQWSQDFGTYLWGEEYWKLKMAPVSMAAMAEMSLARFFSARLTEHGSPASYAHRIDSAPVRARVITMGHNASGTLADLGLDVVAPWNNVAEGALRDLLLSPLGMSVPWLERAYRHGPMRLPIRVRPPAPAVVETPEPRRRSRRK